MPSNNSFEYQPAKTYPSLVGLTGIDGIALTSQGNIKYVEPLETNVTLYFSKFHFAYKTIFCPWLSSTVTGSPVNSGLVYQPANA